MTHGHEPVESMDISVRVNGGEHRSTVAARTTLADHLRDNLGLTGTKLGCEHGVCGACTVVMDSRSVRSCLVLAVQADATDVLTVEGLAERNTLNALQESFRSHHALQCGFCTAGFLMSATAMLASNPTPSRDDVVEGLSGNICRCTGYQKIIEAVLEVAHANEGAAGEHR